ncbi:hypothetical protein [Erwinia pyrifoliae]|uniref:Uncharacterized protein n=1 Tax=Erwinia pyrifoliae TaxID=79967 RepID=A0ABY5XC11_ERWPY|nr:hypothetical protein [Erwinia pyrifoliae]AUX72923.1 hypothetical protein CPI84_10785 [Erwinia pyrifoliae]MCA8876805.1 hypothetical protein [Erwinia pyrifoliae]MCT2386963.1 hypothetical protein [Erwinia pyrifoliae]MCU8587438.1 hypothetical protein [Erwinia pyrifoliae]UWS31285.1 hypothetical protein NYP81_07520 [Erwinia pyrifoliae]
MPLAWAGIVSVILAPLRLHAALSQSLMRFSRYGHIALGLALIGGAHGQQQFITTTLVEIILAAAVLLTVSGFAWLEPAQAISRAG